jgi:general stress protein 26
MEGLKKMSVYEKELEKFIQFLMSHSIWVLATGTGNEISARSMSIINIGTKIYFQTDIHFEKYEHLQRNSNVALCCGNFQIKGHSKILGSTTDIANVDIMNRYKEIHPDSYSRYSNKKTSCLIEIEPTSVQIWDYLESEPYITNINFELKTINIKKYE